MKVSADPAADRQAAGGDGDAGGEIEIVLLNPNRYSEVSARRLRPWLAAVLAELLEEQPGAAGAPGARGAVSLGVRFAGDRAVRRANRGFRGKDQTTDVLSFPGDGSRAGDGAGHLGDVLISVPQARRQAAAADRDPECEIQVLLLHGVLHCLGHDHEVDGGEMESLERRLRRRWIARGPRGPGTGRRAARRAG